MAKTLRVRSSAGAHLDDFARALRARPAAARCAARAPTPAHRRPVVAAGSSYRAAGLGALTRKLSVPGGPAPVKEQRRRKRLQPTGGLSRPKPSCNARTASSVYLAAMIQLILISLVLMA